MKILDIYKKMVEIDASDVYLTYGCPPMFRTNGKTAPWAGQPVLLDDAINDLTFSVMSEEQKQEFLKNFEMNLAQAVEGLGRFRINAYRQQGHFGMVIRQIKAEIPSLDFLQLPEVLKDVIMSKRGLILVVGSTGSGKSTTLAAMIDHRNAHSDGHIITIEDPVEFVHKHKKSVIMQREVGIDTNDFKAALKNSLRQAPDVILLGEIRDTETMEMALEFAETGHLCLGTLHANNANQAIERVMNFFEQERHAQFYMQLSLNLRAIISQRLIRTADDKRVPAVEILIDTPRVKDLILKGEVGTLKETMDAAETEGMMTFDNALFKLWREGRISREEAILNADSSNNVRLKIKMASIANGDVADEDVDRPKLSL